MPAALAEREVVVDGLRLCYREAGSGPAVLLLHGWPTSSYLWRNIAPAIAERGARAIALDLPGFGRSDKPPEASYSFRFHERALSGFLDALGVADVGLALHDLGGPVGLYWASQHPERLRALALLNTLVYPELSWAVVAFMLACRLPGPRAILASRWGLRTAMRLGVADRTRLSEEVIAEYQAPFATRAARRALLKTGYGLHPDGMKEIAAWLPTVRVPVRLMYGARDRILRDVAKTMRRLQADLPQAKLTVLEDCGHFLQEERPAEIGALLVEHFAPAAAAPVG